MNHRHMVIDLGNTRQKMGIYENDQLLDVLGEATDQATVELWEKWKKMHQPDRIGISSTALLTDDQDEWIKQNKVLQISADLNYPFRILYKTPETLGQDRLAAVMAAYALYSGKNVLVVDYGTCITYDLLTSDKKYIGGNITPGIRMRLRAMHDYTDRLPLVDLPSQMSYVGQTTEEALQNGAVGMTIMETSGMILYLKEKYGHLTTVLTGGDVSYFENNLLGEHFSHANLVLTGLNEIMKNNDD